MPPYLSRPTAFSFLTVLLFLFLQAPANAATCVPATPDGTGLQACLETTAPGDTVLLQPGSYVPTTPLFPSAPPQNNTFFIGKRLTIRGAGPGVVLSGALGHGINALNVVIISADAAPGLVTLENLTVQDGDSSAGGDFVGGGILATDNQTVILNNVTVQNNAAVIGGGIWTGSGVDSSWTINNSRFLDNVASGFLDFGGGAIAALPFAGQVSLRIDGSEFEGNTTPQGNGGAVHFFSSGGLHVSNTTFTNNTADLSGGALSISGVGFGQSYLVENCTFGDNAVTRTADGFGGAIDIFSIVGSGRIAGSTFYRNSATFGGGAIYFEFGAATVESSTFSENNSEVLGGAIGIEGDESGQRSTNVTLEGNMFTDNNGPQFGGAVAAFDISGGSGSSLTLTKNHYRRNSAEDSGGAVAMATSENVTMLKEHFNFNWSDSNAGGLSFLVAVSGSIDKIFFNHNDSNDAPHSLFVGGSPDLDIGKVKIAGKNKDHCLINGDPNCP